MSVPSTFNAVHDRCEGRVVFRPIAFRRELLAGKSVTLSAVCRRCGSPLNVLYSLDPAHRPAELTKVSGESSMAVKEAASAASEEVPSAASEEVPSEVSEELPSAASEEQEDALAENPAPQSTAGVPAEFAWHEMVNEADIREMLYAPAAVPVDPPIVASPEPVLAGVAEIQAPMASANPVSPVAPIAMQPAAVLRATAPPAPLLPHAAVEPVAEYRGDYPSGGFGEGDEEPGHNDDSDEQVDEPRAEEENSPSLAEVMAQVEQEPQEPAEVSLATAHIDQQFEAARSQLDQARAGGLSEVLAQATEGFQEPDFAPRAEPQTGGAAPYMPASAAMAPSEAPAEVPVAAMPQEYAPPVPAPEPQAHAALTPMPQSAPTPMPQAHPVAPAPELQVAPATTHAPDDHPVWSQPTAPAPAMRDAQLAPLASHAQVPTPAPLAPAPLALTLSVAVPPAAAVPEAVAPPQQFAAPLQEAAPHVAQPAMPGAYAAAPAPAPLAQPAQPQPPVEAAAHNPHALPLHEIPAQHYAQPPQPPSAPMAAASAPAPMAPVVPTAPGNPSMAPAPGTQPMVQGMQMAVPPTPFALTEEQPRGFDWGDVDASTDKPEAAKRPPWVYVAVIAGVLLLGFGAFSATKKLVGADSTTPPTAVDNSAANASGTPGVSPMKVEDEAGGVGVEADGTTASADTAAGVESEAPPEASATETVKSSPQTADASADTAFSPQG